MHREILRLVPLSDAAAARKVSREMRDEVDEVWGAWGIWATVEDRRGDIRMRFGHRALDADIDFGPLVVWAFDGSHVHHLASLAQWWLALLVAEGPDINAISWAFHYVDRSPLMLTVQARLPVGWGADGKIEWAYALGDEEVARAVGAAVAMGADVNRRLHRAWPLMYCAARGCLEAVKACLAAGAEIDAPGGDLGWETAVVHAASAGHEAVVEALLEAGASAKVGADGQDQTLATACYGHATPGIVRRLVEAGADVNCSALSSRFTPLLYAASRGDVALMEVLLEAGADVDRSSRYGHTAMHEVANGDVVRCLAARGVSVQGDGVRDSPLLQASCDGRVDAVRALLELGADVNCKDRSGMTPLHHAFNRSQTLAAVWVARLLLAAGADPNAVDGELRTPLHWVRHSACVDLLVDAGADLEARDSEGHTPIYTVATSRRGLFEAVLLLAELGADLVNTGGEPGLVMRRVEELRAEFSHGQAA